MQKKYFSYQKIHQTVKKIAQDVITSAYTPDLILAIGGGGLIPARILRTFIKKPIIAVAVSYYEDIEKTKAEPFKLQWLDGVDISGKKILLVDEVDDSRVTLAYCLNELTAHQPAEIGVVVLHSKDKPKRASFPSSVKHFFVGEYLSDVWICYPWDSENIHEHEQCCNAD
ncbi:MAG: phosphoribosyltransferase [Gammaproteobacteria bacterium]